MGNDAEFDVFLCHNSEDKDAVIEIAEQLKQCGVRPWLDEWELRPGLSWQYSLEQQIGQIETAAVFVGETGIGPWQKQEIYAFLNEFVRRGCPVIPVILANAPKQPEIPLFLKSNTWVDFRRQQSDPMERLIWGVTGKKPNRKRGSIEGDNLSWRSEKGRKGGANPKSVPHTSDGEVDYSRLRNLLAAEKWQGADQETLHLMLAVAKRKKDGWLDRESIDSFPCKVLMTIDGLWIRHSNSRFGFSVQKRIWEEMGGRPEFGNDEWKHWVDLIQQEKWENLGILAQLDIGERLRHYSQQINNDEWERFGDRVEWRTGSKWLNYSNLFFNTHAAPGHLPARFWANVGTWGDVRMGRRKSRCHILSRVKTCSFLHAGI